MSRTFTRAIGALTAVALTATLGGCFPVTLTAEGVGRPVSMTDSYGAPVSIVRHFRHDLTVWYAIGLIPLFALPGDVPNMVPADHIVAEVLAHELQGGGDGIVNLHVTQQYTFVCWLANFLPGVVLGEVGTLIKNAGPVFTAIAYLYGLGIQPCGVVVEGDVVITRHGALPAQGTVKLAHGKLQWGGLRINDMLARAARASLVQAPQLPPQK